MAGGALPSQLQINDGRPLFVNNLATDCKKCFVLVILSFFMLFFVSSSILKYLSLYLSEIQHYKPSELAIMYRPRGRLARTLYYKAQMDEDLRNYNKKLVSLNNL